MTAASKKLEKYKKASHILLLEKNILGRGNRTHKKTQDDNAFGVLKQP